MKVLDLFAGTQSVKKALDKMNIDYEYYGVDIYSPEGDNLILDLSSDNVIDELLKLLPKDWTPDFIWASPVCNKFSLSTAVKGGNIYFEKTDNSVKVRQDFSVLANTNYKNMNTTKIREEAEYHINLVKNMSLILEYFNCDYVIENPLSSYIIHFLNPLLIKNNVDYCVYGFDYKKPTSIYSNYSLDLKRCNHKTHDIKIGSKNESDKHDPKSVKSIQIVRVYHLN